MFSKIKCINILAILEFLILYEVSTAVSTALYSICIVLLLSMTLYNYCKMKDHNIIFPDKWFNFSYWPLFVLVIIVSLGIGYSDSIKDAFKFTQWSVITFFAIYFSFQKNFYEHAIIMGIICGMWTLCVPALYQFVLSPLGTRIAGGFSHPNKFCMMFILSLPFLILYIIGNNKNSIFQIALVFTVLVSCCVVAMTGSRGGISGLCFGSLIFLLVQTLYIRKLSWKKLLKGYLATGFMILFIGAAYYGMFFYAPRLQQHISQPSVTTSQNQNASKLVTREDPKPKEQLGMERSYDGERILMWKSSYNMWKDHKLFGVGLGHWNKEYVAYYILPQAKEPTLAVPHNVFFSFLSMTGTLGGIGFLIFMFGTFFYLCHILKKNPENVFLNALLWSFLAIMIHGMVDIGITTRSVMILYSAYLGVGLASVAYLERR